MRKKKVKISKFKRRFRKLSLAALPFIFYLIGLSLISYGLFSYVEQDSVVSMFITQRDDSQNFSVFAAGETTQETSENPNETTSTTAAEQSTYKPKSMQLVDKVKTGATGRVILPFYYIGDQFGVINIPSVEISVNVYHGDSEKEFRKGVGHYARSFFPGQNGNILIAGHRTSFFRNFEFLEIGDQVYFETTYGKFIYTVDEFKIIDETDSSVAEDTSTEQLTMYTCYPFTYFGNAPQRYVVICSLTKSEVNT